MMIKLILGKSGHFIVLLFMSELSYFNKLRTNKDFDEPYQNLIGLKFIIKSVQVISLFDHVDNDSIDLLLYQFGIFVPTDILFIN